MITPIVKKSDSLINILVSISVLTAGAVALMTYLNQKEIIKLQQKNEALDHEIKQLELLKLKHDLDGIN